jgi:hypothetical protein
MGGTGIYRYTGSGSFSQMTVTGGQVRSMYGDQTNSLWVTGLGTINRGVRGAAAATWGYPTPYASNASASPNYMFAVPFTVSSKTELTHLSQLYKIATGSINAKMALYTDVAGNPGSLLAQTGVFNTSAAQNYEVPIVGSQIQLQPGTYWIASVYETSGSTWGLTTSGGPGMRYALMTFSGAFPTTFVVGGTYIGYGANYYTKGFAVP